MARLTKGSRSESEHIFGRAGRKLPLVIFVRPEAGRSIRAQGEVEITLHGGPTRSVTTSSFDVRIGAKNQSCPAIAGSHRNIPQDSLCFIVLGVQTLIM